MPMTVAVCSLFRNSSKTIDYYRGVLQSQIGDDLELVFSFVEGDSTDDTWQRLKEWAADDTRVVLGKMDVEPVKDFDDRVRKWAALCNQTIEQLAGHDYDYLLWCESDLCLPLDLITQLVADDVDVVAPSIFLGGMFYDTWGFRGQDGEHFQNTHPIHPAWQAHGLVELNSVGSVVLFAKSIIDAGVRFRGTYEDGLLVGFCNDARRKGFRVYMDSRLCVTHPTTLWRAQQYSLGSIRLEGFDRDEFTRSIWTSIEKNLREHCDLILGSPEMPEDHPVFGAIRERIAARANELPFTVRSELESESPKRYALVVREVSDETVPCKTDSIP